MLIYLATTTFLALPLAHATIVPHSSDDHISKRLPDTWHQPPDHPAHALFKRQSSPGTDGVTYATVGSSQWYNAYPPALPDNSKLPQDWVNALNAAVSAGKIPDIPPSTLVNGNPVYPNNLSPTGTKVCSGTYKCRIPGDIWDAPAGYIGAGFDDGPLPSSDKLYQFLQQNNQHATHFFIGVNILNNPKEFMTAFETNLDDIAVHTWTHPYMTTLTNLDLIAQFGWSMEIIHNSTGGRLPKFWRPPYGDTDTRVMAIAKEIFGLTTILWNQDTEDWSLTSGGTTAQKINSSMTQWLEGPKSPGLIILEHELSAQAVAAYIAAYPVMKVNGWNITSAAQLAGAFPYQNSDSSSAPVNLANGVLVGDVTSSAAASTGTTALSSGSTSTQTSSGASASGSKPAGKSSSGVRDNAASGRVFSAIIGALTFALLW